MLVDDPQEIERHDSGQDRPEVRRKKLPKFWHEYFLAALGTDGAAPAVDLAGHDSCLCRPLDPNNDSRAAGPIQQLPLNAAAPADFQEVQGWRFLVKERVPSYLGCHRVADRSVCNRLH